MADSSNSKNPQKPGLLTAVFSVIAAFFGVQSDANRRRDFRHGNPKLYIAIGIVLAVLMVFGLLAIVQIVLANSPQ